MNQIFIDFISNTHIHAQHKKHCKKAAFGTNESTFVGVKHVKTSKKLNRGFDLPIGSRSVFHAPTLFS